MARVTQPVTLHAHGCTCCHMRYEDNCDERKVDGLCIRCRSDNGMSSLAAGRLPQECCRTSPTRAGKKDCEKYRLAGAHTWWMCRKCQRTHPFDPRSGWESECGHRMEPRSLQPRPPAPAPVPASPPATVSTEPSWLPDPTTTPSPPPLPSPPWL